MGPAASYFRRSLFGLLAISHFLQDADAQSCPPGWMIYGRSCYEYFDTPMTWEDAETECQGFGMKSHLASFITAQELDVVAKHIFSSRGSGDPIWIGLSDSKPMRTKLKPKRHTKRQIRQRRWRWTDSSTVSYTPWMNGEPNNARQNEHCVEIASADYMGWNDEECHKKNPYLCRFAL